MKFLTQIFLFLSLFSFINTFAQTPINIHILDQETQQGIPDVLLFSIDDNYLGQTNERGKIDINFPSALDSIKIVHQLYKTKKLATKDIKSPFIIVLEEQIITLEGTIISVGKFSDARKTNSYQVSSVTEKEIQEEAPQTAADLIQKTGKVYVQKSQMGGGSPVIRGFEANRVLLVVDGVRMNNAIYRGGHLQNIITIDPNIQDRVEVVYGPNSTIYGSDALGGVIHFHTKRPRFSPDSNLLIKGVGFARYGSVNNEKSFHAHINVGEERLAFLTSINLSNFGDINAGKNKNFFYPDSIWTRPNYVIQREGKDTMLVNDNPYLQRQTGYRQLDFLQHVSIYSKDDNYRHDFSFQFSNSTNIPRYDRLIQYNDDELKYAQWDYGPQKKLFSYYRLSSFKKHKLFTEAKYTASYQNIEESRINRKYQSNDQKNRIENVQVFGVNIDFLKRLKKHRLEYGIESYYNDVHSTAFTKNIETNEETSLDTRYPNGDNYWWSSGIYISHKYPIITDKMYFSDGLRLSHIRLYSEFIPTEASISLPFEEVNQANTALTGNIGLNTDLGKGWKNALLISTGFRAPNIDDVGKTFDSAPGLLVLPNEDLKPEYAYNAEITIQKKWKKESFVEGAVFHTWLTNAIVIDDFQLDGQDSILYEGEMSNIIANTNTGQANVFGVYIGGKWQIIKPLDITTSITYTEGYNISAKEPMGHIPPLYGKVAINFKKEKWKTSISTLFNGRKNYNDMIEGSIDRKDIAVVDYGVPAWMTFNLRGQYQLSKTFLAQAAIENILDTHYIPFASGLSGAGRNFMISLRASF